MKKHSVTISGHATSITLEDPFWNALTNIATARGLSRNKLVSEIDTRRKEFNADNLSSAIRIYILRYHQEALVALSSKD